MQWAAQFSYDTGAGSSGHLFMAYVPGDGGYDQVANAPFVNAASTATTIPQFLVNNNFAKLTPFYSIGLPPGVPANIYSFSVFVTYAVPLVFSASHSLVYSFELYAVSTITVTGGYSLIGSATLTIPSAAAVSQVLTTTIFPNVSIFNLDSIVLAMTRTDGNNASTLSSMFFTADAKFVINS
jgi:hypothetical protein